MQKEKKEIIREWDENLIVKDKEDNSNWVSILEGNNNENLCIQKEIKKN